MKRPKFNQGDTVVWTPSVEFIDKTSCIVTSVKFSKWSKHDPGWRYCLLHCEGNSSHIPESELQSFEDAFPCEPAPATPPLSELLSWG
jgi:hypothetical protein